MAVLRRKSTRAQANAPRSDEGGGLRSVLGGVELPTFPAVVMAAIEKLGEPDAALDQVADIIVRDPGFSVQLLKIVNSAAFAPRNQVRSVHQAVVMLGRNEVESLLLSVAVQRSLPRERATGFEPDRFWATSARRAAAAVTLAEVVDPARRSEYFTASLLQDMALPVLAHHEHRYGEVLDEWHRGSEDLVDLEHLRFDFDHATVASWMCDQWRFPPPLADAVARHHDDPAAADTELPLVHDLYGIAKDRALELVEEGFEQAEGVAGMFTRPR